MEIMHLLVPVLSGLDCLLLGAGAAILMLT